MYFKIIKNNLLLILSLMLILIWILILINNYNYKELFISKIPIITFIIPSIGRPTILRTIRSLQNLNNKNWEAIVVFDGVKSNINHIKDNRIKTYEIAKRGYLNTNGNNMAGITRNYGINMVKNSKWIGFVDDDDTISPNYIDNILNSSKYNPDCIIFRMYGKYKTKYRVIPSLNSINIKKNDVGISFCVKYNIIKSIKFQNNTCEDYILLKKLSTNYNILLSQNITYFVRMQPINKIYTSVKGTELLNPKFVIKK